MNIQRFIVIVAAIAINVAVLASFHGSRGAIVGDAPPPQRTQNMPTLPVITVRPTAQQWRELGRTPAPAASA
ncbi:MAG TPA: hypothetical protein VHA71_08520 [Rhodanobacteraceae bacterium]|jgi:hypothetical protein|nr:hypothetical protein [Rhodanobacteraceae bacterium]